ncbi:ATP-binding cassette domain-containing protein [Carnobacterium gallinarum]|uniref:ATP-binding cassette domain-containing protein n=1 Tax=Carnobacterium gallinarum TaxID=2749 RepID=UPI0005573258|nr:ATP-binding cassette domain-containing protein [Carnobacterium gallinarum]
MKYKHNMQNLQSDCGIAVTKTMLEQVGLKVSDTVFNLQLVENKGLSINDIIEVFLKYEIESNCYRVDSIEEIKKLDHSFIVVCDRYGLTHYIVIHSYDRNKLEFLISDPSKPDIESIDEKELEDIFLGYLIKFENSGKKIKNTQSVKKNKSGSELLYKSILGNLNFNVKVELFFITLFKYLLPIMFYQILQNVLTDNFAHVHLSTTILYLAFYIPFFIGMYLLSIRNTQIKLKIENLLQKKVIEIFYKSNMNHNESKKNMNNIIGYLVTLMGNSSGLAIKFFLKIDCIYAIFLILLLAKIHITFPLIFAGVLLLYIVYIRVNLKKIANYEKYSVASNNNFLSTFEEHIMGSMDIKLFSKSKAAKNYLDDKIEMFFKARYLEEILQNKINIASNISTFTILVLILLVTFVSFTFFENPLYPLTSGMYVFFVIINILEGIVNNYLAYKMSSISAGYIETIKAISLGEELHEDRFIQIDNFSTLVLENISFQYDYSESIIKKLDLTLSCGEIIAIKGNNGMGKTTLTKIISGLLSPNQGSIYLSAKGYPTLSNTDILKYISFYSPEEHIFYGSVKENVNMTLFEHESKKNYQSIFDYHLQSDELLFSQGTNISQGQKQKVLLDRCMSKRESTLFILDEPSGNLDNHSRIDLIKHILKLKEQNKMVLLITHESSLLEICDQVFTMKDGVITHEQS